MVDRVVAPKGQVGGGEYDCLSARTAMEAGSWAGDNVYFRGDRGLYGLADLADFPHPGASNAALPTNPNSCGGVRFGSGYTATSKASGVNFYGQSAYGQAVFDMRGGSTNAQRAKACITVQGEDFRFIGFQGYAPNQNYMEYVTPYAAPYAEAISEENYGFYLLGVHGSEIRNNVAYGAVGTDKAFSPGAICVHFSTSGAGSANRTTVIEDNDGSGSKNAFFVGPGGFAAAGTLPPSGAGVIMRRNRGGACTWGRLAGGDSTDGYNACNHGGPFSLTGEGFARFENIDSEAYGPAQDAMETIGVGLSSRYFDIHDIVGSTLGYWVYTATPSPAWVFVAGAHGTGNGLKMGLSGYTGTSPTTWLGTDGVAGGSWNVDEDRPLAYGGRVRNTKSFGITTNGAKGAYIAFCELTDVGAGIGLANVSTNYFVEQNYVRMKAGSANAALDIYGGRTWSRNNILNGASPGQDVWLRAGTMQLAQKNVLVNGRIAGGYSAVNDINAGAATDVSAWVDGQGLPAGHALQGVGDVTNRLIARMANRRDRLRRLISLPPTPGCYRRSFP